jgi:hypothetical protein
MLQARKHDQLEIRRQTSANRTHTPARMQGYASHSRKNAYSQLKRDRKIRIPAGNAHTHTLLTRCQTESTSCPHATKRTEEPPSSQLIRMLLENIVDTPHHLWTTSVPLKTGKDRLVLSTYAPKLDRLQGPEPRSPLLLSIGTRHPARLRFASDWVAPQRLLSAN